TYAYRGVLVTQTYQDATTQLRVDYTHDADGQVVAATRYSDVAGTQRVGQTQYAYDGGRVVSIAHIDGTGSTLASYTYAYDAAGRLTAETDNGATTTYSYDATNQLTQAGATGYSYDANGNPTSNGAILGANNE